MSWNVMVYMSGDNDLSDEMVWGLQDMIEASGKFDNNVRLVVQFDPLGGYPRTYKITKKHPRGSLRDYEKDRLTPEALSNRHFYAVARETLVGVQAAQASDRRNVIERFIGLSTDAAKAAAEAQLTQFSGLKDEKGRPYGPANLKGNLERWLREQTGLMLDDISVRAQLQSFVIEEIGLLEPAGKYMIVLSGHGSGSTGDFLSADDPRSALSIKGMATFLRQARIALADRRGRTPKGVLTRTWWQEVDWGRKLTKDDKIDVLGLDSCLVSMAEVCYEVREHVTFLVGTESFVSNLGWPYRRLLDSISPDRSAQDVVAEFVREYGKFYTDYEEARTSTDLVGVDLTKMEGVKNVVNVFVDGILGKLEPLRDLDEIDELDRFPERIKSEARQAITTASVARLDTARQLRNALILAHWYAQSYRGENYTDLWDFCDQLGRFLHRKHFNDVLDACGKVKTAVEAAVPSMITIGSASQHSHGLAVYFPWDAAGYSHDYQKLAFAIDSKWDEFLRVYLRVTRRVRRDQENHVKVEDGVLKTTDDVIRHGVNLDPLDEKAPGSRYPQRGPRTFPAHGTRDFPEYGTRDYPEYGTRDFPEYGTKYGKLRGTGAKNPPDGFYRPKNPPWGEK